MPNQRLGRALGAAGQGLMNMGQMMEQAKAKREELAMRQEQLAEQRAQQEQALQQQKISTGFSILNTGQKYKGKLRKTYYEQMTPQINSMLNTNFNPEILSLEENKEHWDTYIRGINPSTAGSISPDLFNTAISALAMGDNGTGAQMMKPRQEALAQSELREKGIQVDIGGTKVSPQAVGQLPKSAPAGTEFKVEKGGLALGKEEFAPGRAGETGFDKSYGAAAGKDLRKAVTKLPKVKFGLKKLEAAGDILKKVETGPLAGQDIFYYLQTLKPNGDEAQTLKWILSETGVNLIMEFAAQAGVRAIDTEAERQFLLGSIVNQKMDPKTFRRALVSLRIATEEGMRRTQEERKFMSKPGARAVEFVSSLENKDVYVDPKTLKYQWVDSDKEPPKGMVSYTEFVGGEAELGGTPDADEFGDLL